MKAPVLLSLLQPKKGLALYPFVFPSFSAESVLTGGPPFFVVFETACG
jgi:hypothetical protein